MTLSIQKLNIRYCKETETFHLDGNLVPFKPTYTLLNSETGREVIFRLSHSTGSEWDKNTKWIFKAVHLTLEVSNHIPEGAKEAYLNAKTSY